ncbi:MAG: CHAT domain-containing protein [Sphingomicrobium sp.]
MTSPVVLLAFANDQDDHLENLVRERKSIGEALRGYEDQRFLRLQVEPNAGIDDLFGLFDRFADQVAIFHYAGHADGTALKLELAGGASETAHAGGLAQMLGLSKALKLVFLNGCATHDQVKALLDRGVKAVIATAVPINDTMATEFAQQFYETLGSGKSIRQSFDAARAKIASRYGDKREIGEFRSISFGGKAETVDAALTWGLYTQPDDDETLNWVLPQQADNEVIVRGAALTQSAGVAVNDGLIQTLFNALAPFSLEVGMLLELSKKSNRTDLRTVRQMIMDAYPAPVGEQLRKLFASSSIDVQRLRQLVVTYESVTKLFAFAMLSQLWNARFDNKALKIDEAQWSAIEAYLKLDAASEPAFDYLVLILTIDAVLTANNIPAFMKECSTLAASLTDGEGSTAQAFMNEMRAELVKGTPPSGEIESFCVQAETHLGVILKDFAFLVAYKLATIKSIAISKSRHKPAEFSHRQVMLDRLTAGFLDLYEVRTAFTDNESVILLKDLEDVSQYLNLTPFIIDQNALTKNESSKLYFHQFTDAAGDACHYYSIADPTDVLVISDAMDDKAKDIYLPIRDLIREFREGMAR